MVRLRGQRPADPAHADPDVGRRPGGAGGAALRDRIGMGQIMFETDYPHGGSTFPHSRDTAATIASKAGLSEQGTWRLLRGNAISCYRLDRYGITA
jgi:hypothetical protein